MHNLLSLVLSLIAFCAFGQKETNQFNVDGQKEGFWIENLEDKISQGNYSFGRQEGLWKTYYNIKNINHLAQLAEYSKGVYHGSVYSIDYGGHLASEENYVHGKLHGKRIYYRKHGGIKSEENYVGGQLEGPFSIYYETGAIQEKGNYSLGKRDGLTQWFNEQAELIMSSTYKKGVLDGPQRLFNKSKLISNGNYRNNQKVGIWKHYDANGKLIREEKF